MFDVEHFHFQGPLSQVPDLDGITVKSAMVSGA